MTKEAVRLVEAEIPRRARNDNGTTGQLGNKIIHPSIPHKCPIGDFRGSQDRVQCLPRMSGLFLITTMEDVQVNPVPVAPDIRPRYTWKVFRATQYLI